LPCGTERAAKNQEHHLEQNHNSCGWKKTIKGVSSGNNGFSSAEEATLDMQRFYAAAVEGASRQ